MSTDISTDGGAVVQGHVNASGDFIGRDKIEININITSLQAEKFLQTTSTTDTNLHELISTLLSLTSNATTVTPDKLNQLLRSSVVWVAPGSTNVGTCGFFVNSSGYVVTVDLAVTKQAELSVRHLDKVYPAEIIVVDEKRHLALLKVDGTSYPYLTLHKGENPHINDEVFILGWNPEVGWQFSGGQIVKPNILANQPDRIYSKLVTRPGFSGSPVININGEVVGVHESRRSDGFRVSISSSLALQILLEQGILNG